MLSILCRCLVWPKFCSERIFCDFCDIRLWRKYSLKLSQGARWSMFCFCFMLLEWSYVIIQKLDEWESEKSVKLRPIRYFCYSNVTAMHVVQWNYIRYYAYVYMFTSVCLYIYLGILLSYRRAVCTSSVYYMCMCLESRTEEIPIIIFII